jgi:hypothetical protein
MSGVNTQLQSALSTVTRLRSRTYNEGRRFQEIATLRHDAAGDLAACTAPMGKALKDNGDTLVSAEAKTVRTEISEAASRMQTSGNKWFNLRADATQTGESFPLTIHNVNSILSQLAPGSAAYATVLEAKQSLEVGHKQHYAAIRAGSWADTERINIQNPLANTTNAANRMTGDAPGKSVAGDAAEVNGFLQQAGIAMKDSVGFVGMMMEHSKTTDQAMYFAEVLLTRALTELPR